jgi:uncharacterized membrane protein
MMMPLHRLPKQSTFCTIRGARLATYMRTLVTDSFLELLVWSVLLVTMVTTAVLAIRKIRSKTLQQELRPSDLLANFRELHDRGELSDAEFRTIKATLAARLQQELKDNVKTG